MLWIILCLWGFLCVVDAGRRGNKITASLWVMSGSGREVLIPLWRSFFTKITHAALFSPIPEFLFCFQKQYNKNLVNKAHSIVWFQQVINFWFERRHHLTPVRLIRTCCSNTWFPEFLYIQAKKSRIPCWNFGESRFPEYLQNPISLLRYLALSWILHHILFKSRIPKVLFQTLWCLQTRVIHLYKGS